MYANVTLLYEAIIEILHPIFGVWCPDRLLYPGIQTILPMWKSFHYKQFKEIKLSIVMYGR